MNQYLAENVR